MTHSRSRTTWLRGVKRLVVKVGTTTLTAGTRELSESLIAELARQIVAARQQGLEVILVTSGAIGVGSGRLKLRSRPRDIGSLQAAAAVGQSLLMHTYETAFRALGQPVAQVLITAGDLRDRRRYVNFSNAIAALFRYGVVPIVNENDTISVDEIRVGDNDTLSAHVANASDADLLVLLSDIEGLYTADPNTHPGASLIPEVDRLTPQVHRIADGDRASGAGLGTGRLATKLRAAEIVVSSGKPMVLARGGRPNVLTDILDGEEVGTLFCPSSTRLGRRKRWIAYTLSPRGALTLDDGAVRALTDRGKSLLPSGVIAVDGTFAFGDPVRCLSAEGTEFARGLVNYAADEIRAIQGSRTAAIESILGYHFADEVIHRDNLVLIDHAETPDDSTSADPD
ncbi:glutamate 5-kinase [Candidatus Poribacteria bacterium]|nr:glutamate 5-kinase [Candidatus Poribacteria bacterium]